MSASHSKSENIVTKLFVETHGCQMNEYDSLSMINVLKQSQKIELTQSEQEANLILLNTCSIREKAQNKVYSQLGRWHTLKQKNKEVLIGVGGCVASQEGEDILKRAPFVDIVFGPQTLHRLPHLVNQVRETGKSVVDVSFPEIEKFDCLPKPELKGVKAFVSIMEGCSKYCSFCVVPYTRGEEISRPLDDVLTEVYHLAEQGCKEITFLGQNVNAYQGSRYEGGTADLADLIYYVAALENIQRIRFTTSHPLEFSERLIQAYADVSKLANHLHLPVQSGSNKILSAMKRGYTHQIFREKIQKLRQIRSNISISSDFIVGFPNETQEDFEATLDLVKTVRFDKSYSFLYSQRPGTPAAKLSHRTPLSERKKRLEVLQSHLKEYTNQTTQSMIGTTQRVLVESVLQSMQGFVKGTTGNNRVVKFQASSDFIGKIVPVTIYEVSPHILLGEIISS